MSADYERGRPSYEKINYSLRPAKAIERRMLCEVFGRLYPFQPVEHYGYIGFGSIYFTDFQLIHRVLGINDLISIERDIDNAERFRLNLPFGCITLHFAESSAILPNLNWDQRRIVWLDYDGALSPDGLADIATVVSKAASGSFLVLSINAQPIGEPSEEQRKQLEEKTGESFRLSKYRLSKLKELLGTKVPEAIDGKMLNVDGLSKVFRQIVLNEIKAQLTTRNQMLAPEDQFIFEQQIHFLYRDGALMLTLGGIICKKSDLPTMQACRFSELDFVRGGEDSFLIKVPCLTPREMRHLNSFLPTEDTSKITRSGIPEDDVARYTEIYRYFPSFSEVLFH